MKISVRALGPIKANCYIVDGRLMIDPGDDTAGLDAFIREEGAGIEACVITHGHFDHMLGAQHIQKKYGARLMISRADAPALESAKKAVTPWDYEDHFTPTQADELLDEGKREICGIPFELLLTPGHTPGGLCLLNREAGVLFTGDTLFRFGYGRTDLPGGDMAQLRRSLMRLLTLDDSLRVYPGHGESACLKDIKRSFGL